ncbi:hypothetical protein GGE16_003039 [Rhizobium leguminosarum]|uniref:Transmembrane protein n=1 Tax=Rhizobium leguminosarum TaxID=384 RepID=A0AAE2SWZ5_RHILE|nr:MULTISPECIES: hypothetical protein [Rhizobium]MBB4290980.1 hypothetical protein [Rhizobium leguminosarum]MBB4297924.1 hypothetical protein [Rhizobium leguminosarum]MBB4309063.1 hypothetical protein [Rhizobium leguminosarum]MBB4416900.1 hypothetical protein [Rhizobium leguminosarum]MBB4430131.1 hypothetical protein [Rhizobium esperanzae]
MEEWFSYLMSCFHMALQNAVFFMATVRNDRSFLDDWQFAALVLGLLGIIVLLVAALVRMSWRLQRSEIVIRSLNDDLAQVTQDLNVERVWRLAGGDSTERPSADSLKELYKILARRHEDASYMV